MSFLPGSPQTKSFIILFAIALAGTVICLLVSDGLTAQSTPTPGFTLTDYTRMAAQASQNPPVPAVNTSGWKTYVNSDFHFSFLYDPLWTIKKDTKLSTNAMTVYTVNPGKKYDNFKLYISANDFYAMQGIPTTPTIIDGKPAIGSQEILYGVQANNLYYTLDLGSSLSLTPQFNAWVQSFKFQ